MRIDHCISTIDEESKFAKTAAIADKIYKYLHEPSGYLYTGKRNLQMSALCFLTASASASVSLKFIKLTLVVCAHSLGKLKTFLISVYCTDVFNTHSTKYCDTDQTDRSASLYNNSAVETKDSCCFCSLYRMYKYSTWLNQDSGIQIQITYIKECSSKASAS